MKPCRDLQRSSQSTACGLWLATTIDAVTNAGHHAIVYGDTIAIAIPYPMRPVEYIKDVVQGAVVLFPHPDEEAYRKHRFFASIGQVEIGGLPFLPNATTLVAEKIASLLATEYPDR